MKITTVRRPQPGEMIVGEGVYYSRDGIATQRNNNLLVVGASGAGKTRHVVVPNLLQCNGSYVVTDAKGILYDTYGDYLRSQGYNVMKLNFSYMGDPHSEKWNPFRCVLTDQDVVSFAHDLVFADGDKTTDRFWDESNVTLLSAIIAFLRSYCTAEEQTMTNLNKILCMGRNCSDGESNTPADYLFEDAEKRDPDGFAVRQWKMFKTGSVSEKTTASMLVTAAMKTAIYNVAEAEQLLSESTFSFADIAREKTVLFVIVSDTDRTYDTITSLFFSQLLKMLIAYADSRPERRLPVETTLIMDDFATNVTLSDFARSISSIRSRGMSAMMMVQDVSQLTARYGDEASTIVGCCDTVAYMGSNSIDGAENIARRANMPLRDILEMPVGRMWIFRRGEAPVYTNRYDITESEKMIERGRTQKKEDGITI